MKRFEAARIYGQFFILPSLGILFRVETSYAPRVAIAWLCWGMSFGLGREEVES